MNEKPKNCQYPNCQNCTYTDCIYDGLEHSDVERQDKFDNELEIIELKILSRRKRQARYFRSEKGKIAQKKYLQSIKGREMVRRKGQKRIENGKNAEYCKRYYEKHKEEMKIKARERYAKQKLQIVAGL